MTKAQRAEQSKKNLAKARAAAAKKRIARKRIAEKERLERLRRVGAEPVDSSTPIAPSSETFTQRVMRIVGETEDKVRPFDPSGGGP